MLPHADWEARVAEGLPPEIGGQTPLDLFGHLTGLPAGSEQVSRTDRGCGSSCPRRTPRGHAALVVDGAGVLVAGDVVSDVLIPMLDDPRGPNDPVEDYLLELELLEGVTDGAEVVVPGHGSVGGAEELHERIAQDRAYRHALRDGRDPDDRRIGPSAQPGWEWVADISAGQADNIARRRQPAAGGEHR